MIDIIKNGDTHKRIECESCGCIFEFCGLDTEDDIVECPECGFSQDTEDDVVEWPEFGFSQDTSDAVNSYSVEKTVENILKEEHKDTDEYVKLQEERIKDLKELENRKIIEEQKKEIKRLNDIIEGQRAIIDDFIKKYEEKSEELKRALSSREQLINTLNKNYGDAKINAYEEFASELNQRLIKPILKESYAVKSDIDETLSVLKEKQKYQCLSILSKGNREEET